MGRKRQSRQLILLMNGQLVGQLTKSLGVLAFQYDADWLKSDTSVPLSLSIPLSTTIYRGDLIYRFFDNLLPDSVNIRQRMQAHLQADSIDAFDLLAEAGADCIGAIQLVSTLPAPPVKQVHANAISDENIANILKAYKQLPLGMTPEEDEFRISLAGQQEKSAFLWHQGRWKRPYGTTPTSHIFKLPIGQLEQAGIDLSDSVENEWLCLRIAKAFGLPVAKAEIAVFKDVKVLIVERFDRRWSANGSWLIRRPQEDMCQALDYSPGQKYESDGGPGIAEIMDLLLQSTNPLEDRTRFMRSQVFFWLLAAPDGHAKNFSIHIGPDGRFKLAPLYDVISAFPMVDKGEIQAQRVKLAMAVLGKNRHYRWNTVLPRHWNTTARKCGFPEDEIERILMDFAMRVDEVVALVREELPAGFPVGLAESIFNGLTGKCAGILRGEC